MTKATCSKCGFVVELKRTNPQGKDYVWELDEAIDYLLSRQKNHRCYP